MPNFRVMIIKAFEREGSKAFAFIAFCIFVLASLGVFEPLETSPQLARDKLRSKPASGDIVLVAIDDKSLSLHGTWPWKRSDIAKIVTQIDAAGAKRIAIDIDLNKPGVPEDDAKLVTALRDAKAELFLRHEFSVGAKGERTNYFPAPIFAQHAQIANSNMLAKYDGFIYKSSIAVEAAGSVIPSMAATLAGVDPDKEDFFLIDYGLDIDSVPTISAVDIIDGRSIKEIFRNKTILITGTSSVEFPQFQTTRWASQSAGTLFVASAETIISGKPTSLGFLLFFSLATFLGFYFIFGTRKILATWVMSGGIISLIFLPLLLNIINIRVDIVPSACVLALGAGMRAYLIFRERMEARNLVDPISELPNMGALKRRREVVGGGVVALRIINMADVSYALRDSIPGFYQAIGATLGLQGTRDNIFHVGQGSFIAFYDGLIGEQLDQSVCGLHSLIRTVQIDGKPVDIIAAFGVCDEHGSGIYDKAQKAMIGSERALERGGGIVRFEKDGTETGEMNLSLNSEMEAAIEQGDIFVVWQPKINVHTGAPQGGEVLSRWNHPERGPIPADQFIKMAEKHNRMEKLTQFVLDQAIGFIVDIANQDIVGQSVSVNLSAKLLTNPQLPTMIGELLTRHRCPPELLMLEITETAAMANGQEALAILADLRRLGIHLSIDDYGTGLSTLEYLRKVPASEIKIDRTFVDAMETSRSDAIMVRSTIQLAHSLGRKVVAEGVERASTVEKLRQMQCDLVQGYYYSKPIRLHEARLYLLNAKEHIAAAA
jgi:EAL domain-containing protein (putative c-di-GMP-specific phosphodiesterase class I)